MNIWLENEQREEVKQMKRDLISSCTHTRSKGDKKKFRV